jgi:hypothetical protein
MSLLFDDRWWGWDWSVGRKGGSSFVVHGGGKKSIEQEIPDDTPATESHRKNVPGPRRRTKDGRDISIPTGPTGLLLASFHIAALVEALNINSTSILLSKN